MSVKMITMALAATLITGFATAPSASAQSYGGGPTCSYGQDYDTVNQRCVWVRGYGPSSRANRIRPWTGYSR